MSEFQEKYWKNIEKFKRLHPDAPSEFIEYLALRECGLSEEGAMLFIINHCEVEPL